MGDGTYLRPFGLNFEECHGAPRRIRNGVLVTNWLHSPQRYLVLDNHVAAHWGARSVVDLAMADKVETVSMAWSPKISLDNIGSLLALGNKAGDITIWHVTDPNNVCCVKSWKSSSDSWIIRLSWSPWTIENDRYVSILSYASADGIVHAHKIKFDSKSPLEGIEVSENIMCSSVQTLHPCTMMRWSPTITQNITQPNTLAFSRGNRLNVWFPEADKTITWRKPIAKAIADITWDTFGEKIFVFFMDGKHSVLRVQEEELVVDEESVEFIYHEIISRCHVQARTNITQDEGEGDNANADDEGGDEETSGGVAGGKLQLHIVSGDRSVDGLQLSTLYYVTSPFHMEFQRERFQSCTVVFSKAHKSVQDQLAKTLFEQLDRFIRLPNAALTRNPSYQLWDIGLLIGESAQANESDMRYMNQLLGVLNTKVFQSRQDIEALSKRETLPDPTTTTESRLQMMIYSEPSIAADRVSVYLRDMLRNWLGSSAIKNQLEQRAAEGESRIRKHCTKTILKLFSEISSATPNPQPGSELEVQMNGRHQRRFMSKY
ncbi:hypothetical protein BGZ80_009689 [Entomortierella chlamydospora]|uniref:Transcription factor IIIC 90kDa subunit N-terminal domain-containing protein n=1 Tax=Entomortierella chlamydospora TaxID=101097 RepID=A0A9P6MW52_9FUNG|nr:hypothetical protein BGZ80_009689 [Entomortierella chlamydospora]